MKSKWMLTAALTLGTVALTVAQAEPVADSTVTIGRVKVALTESNWEKYPAPSLGIKVASGHGEIRSEAGLLVLRRPDGQVAAAVMLGATWGRSQLSISNSCTMQDGLYVHDFSGGQSQAMECVRAGGPFPTDMLVSQAMPRLKAALEPLSLKLPEVSYPVWLFMANRNASIVMVEGVVAADFVGLPNQTPLGKLPPNLQPMVAAWADTLGATSKQAVNSMSGELAMPAVAFGASQSAP